jgi:hypothetical protein
MDKARKPVVILFRLKTEGIFIVFLVKYHGTIRKIQKTDYSD